jgi:hypothetical protein
MQQANNVEILPRGHIGRELWYDALCKKSCSLVHQFLIGMNIATLEADSADNRCTQGQDCDTVTACGLISH